jgi:hypothetical protein
LFIPLLCFLATGPFCPRLAEHTLDKKRKSIEQLSRAVADSPELFEDHIRLIKEAQETSEHLSQLREKYHVLTETMKVQMGADTKTIIRSLYEVAIKKFINEAWGAAGNLFTIIYGEQAPYDVLVSLPSNQELLTRTVALPEGKLYSIPSAYEGNCDVVVFLREIANLSNKEKSARWRSRWAARVNVVTELEGIQQPEEDVRQALDSIFRVLSDEVHLAAARFESDGNFYLPRAGNVFTFSQILAMATIVAESGLAPKYPTAPQELSLAGKL